jgi:hypothetical protein
MSIIINYIKFNFERKDAMNFKKHLRSLFSFLMLSIFSLSLLTGCSQEDIELATAIVTTVIETEMESETTTSDGDYREVITSDSEIISEDGTYTSKEEVALYIYTYNHLPSNYITKKEAKALGWINSEGNLWEVAPGMSIGGDYFGNYEGLLPEEEDRDYYECDIDFDGTYRNAKRIVFSNDGLIYYTEDHYDSFELLYGEE